MNNTIKAIAIFIAGVGAGVIASKKFFEEKYKRIADEEIASVKEVYSEKVVNKAEEKTETTHDEIENELAKVFPNLFKVDRDSYSKILNELRYSKDDSNKKETEEITIIEPKPYVIPPEEFDEGDYQTETLTYYADGVLTDDFDNVIENVEAMVGEDSLNHFGEYEPDSVYVRNDAFKTDYEILLDVRNHPEHSTSYTCQYPGDDE